MGGHVISRMAATCALVAAAFLSSGCAVKVTTPEGERRLALRSDEFASYVEHVFREQNRVAGEIGFALLDAELAGHAHMVARLEEAEARLLAACEALNELATARRDGATLPRRRALRAARSTPDCERATAVACDELTLACDGRSTRAPAREPAAVPLRA